MTTKEQTDDQAWPDDPREWFDLRPRSEEEKAKIRKLVMDHDPSLLDPDVMRWLMTGMGALSLFEKRRRPKHAGEKLDPDVLLRRAIRLVLGICRSSMPPDARKHFRSKQNLKRRASDG